MANVIRLKRSSVPGTSPATLADGELALNTADEKLFWLASDGSTVRGINLTSLVTTAQYTASDVLSKLLSVDGSSSGLDADLLDGYHASSGTTSGTIAVRNGSGQLPGDITGNAATATALQASRTISLSGDASGSASFDGTTNVSLSATLTDSGVSANTYGSATSVPVIAVDAKGRITSATNTSISIASSQISDATATATNNAIVKRDGSGSFATTAITLGADPVNSTDAATKNYVDKGIYKQSVRLVATGNVALAAAAISSVDSATLQVGDRVLMTAQSTASQNGIYIFNGSGQPWTRASDADSSEKVMSGMTVRVTAGSNHGDTTWFLTTNDPIILGTTSLSFQKQVSGETAGLSSISGTGLVVRTATSGTYTPRTITPSAAVTSGGTGYISITNGDGVSGNPTLALVADTANTASTLVARDASGNFSAGTVTAALSGNASTATALQTSRTIAISGDVTGTATAFDGSADISISSTLASSGVSQGTYGAASSIPIVTVDAKGRVTAVSTAPTSVNWKTPVRAVSTTNITLSSPGATIDSVTMASGDRILLTGQTTASQNGIYVWTGAASALTRATDADSSALMLPGTMVLVTEGATANTDTVWMLTTNGPITLGTTNLTFTRVISAESRGLAGLSSSGLLARTGTGTFSSRTITPAVSVTTGGTGYISVTNGNGVSGNPTIALVADTANTASTLVARDASGNFSAGTITAAINGTASTATKLFTARTIALSGDITGTATSFDGSANITITTTIAPTAAVSMNSQRITNVADPSAAQDAATKNYVDAAISGLDFKAAVRVAVGTNVNISSPGTTLDGVSMANGDRVLLYGQSTGSQNGIYVFNGSASAMTRSSDADANAEVTAGLTTFVIAGTANSGKQFTLITADPITVGTTALTFTQTNVGTTYTNGNGLDLTGTTFSVKTASSSRIAVGASGVDLATTGVSANTYRSVTVDTYGRVTGGTNPTTLAGYGITDAQPLDNELTAIAGLTSEADTAPYFTGSGTASLMTVTSLARTLLDDTTQSAMQTTLGLGTAATKNTGTASGNVPLLDSNGKIPLSASPVAFASAFVAYFQTSSGDTVLSSAPATIDGEAMSAGDLVWVNGYNEVNSGLYVWSSAGAAMTRATSMPSGLVIPVGAPILITNGADYGNKLFALKGPDGAATVTVGTSTITAVDVTASSSSSSGSGIFTLAGGFVNEESSWLASPTAPNTYIQSGDAFLFISITSAADNGIYVWNGVGVAATRHPNYPVGYRMYPGSLFMINYGPDYLDMGYETPFLLQQICPEDGVIVDGLMLELGVDSFYPADAYGRDYNGARVQGLPSNLGNYDIGDQVPRVSFYQNAGSTIQMVLDGGPIITHLSPCRVAVASMSSGAISSYSGAAIDGVTINNGDRILVCTGSTAGIYVWDSVLGSLYRDDGCNGTYRQIRVGTLVRVFEGTHANKTFRLSNPSTTNGRVEVGTDTYEFVEDAGSGGGVTISDTAPSSPSAGDMWLDSTSGSLRVRYDDTWIEPVAATPPAKPVTGLTYCINRGAYFL